MTFTGRLCLSTFLFCLGYSLAITHRNGINWPKFINRFIKIALAAGLVSLGTYLIYPQHWIYFGILHNIALASLLALAFLRIPLVALLIGTSMMSYWIVIYFLIRYYAHNPADLIPVDPMRLRPSLDFISLFPWFGAVLIGIGAHKLKLHEHISIRRSTTVEFLSRHSLIIYLVHQPLLFGSLWLVLKMTTA